MSTHEVLGQTVTMQVRDGTNATVMYDVPLDAAQALAPAGFEVIEQFTCEAGNQIWGFPTSIERIEVTNDESTRGGTDEMPAEELASLGLPDAPVVLTTWTEQMRAAFGEPEPVA